MPAIRALVGKIFPRAFGTTRKVTSDYKGFSEQSSNQLRSGNNNNKNSNSKGPGRGKHIKVKTEWVMYSHHAQEEQGNASDIQLVPVGARVSEGDESSTSLRPAKDIADMQTICKADRADDTPGIAK